MANNCDTTYKITGSKDAVMNLYDTVLSLSKGELDLEVLASHYGIDWMKRNISVRGYIYDAEKHYDPDNDYYEITIYTISAWAGCHDLFNAINYDVFDGALSISYCEVEPGCCVYCVHDEQGFFPEECYIDAGGVWDGIEPDAFFTTDDAISYWCKEMGIERGDRTQDEMLELINNYEYEDKHTYFYINLFVRE